MVSDYELREATGEDPGLAFHVDAMDITSGRSAARILSFLDDPQYAESAIDNPHLAVLLTTPALARDVKWPQRITVVAVDDPRWSFYTLANHLVKQRPELPRSVIHPSATVSPLAHIAERGVVVGPGCVIEPYAALYGGVALGENVVIRSHAVVGNIGFEHKRTSRGVLSVLHDGGVVVGRRTEIGSHCNVAQGFARRQTSIGDDVRIDSMTHIAHGCQIADETFIAAGVTISGSVVVGRRVWIGPGVTVRDQVSIGDDSRVAIGAVVLRDVAMGSRVAGNPARAQP